MNSDNTDQLAQLERLARLHADGSLSAEEFSQLKSKLLDGAAASEPATPTDHVPLPAEPPQAQPLRNELEPVTLATVIGWAWTAFFAILGLALLFQLHSAAGGLLLLSALIAFPPINALMFASMGLHAQILKPFPLVISAGLALLGGSWLGLTHPAPIELAATDGGSTVQEAPQSPIAPSPETAPPTVSTAAPNPSPPQPEPETPDTMALAALQSRFGNTVITQSAAAEWHLHFNAGGTLTGKEMRSGFVVSGTWRIADGEVCVTFDPAIPGTDNPECKPVDQHQVGERWLANGTLTILAHGIQ